MSCNIAKFTITKGVENTFVFNIKANGSTLPMVIDDTVGFEDTFQATIISLDPEVTVPFLTKPLTITSAINGQVTLTITEAEADTAVVDKGSKTDRYYSRPVYKLIIDCDTTNNGKFIAKVAEIYVD